MDAVIYPRNGIKARLRVPGDKSVSHRAVMLGSIARGETRYNYIRPAIYRKE